MLLKIKNIKRIMVIDKKTEIYKLLVEKLYERCQRYQVENERCVMRINAVKKLTRKRNRDVELLKRRLDKHQDSWRAVPMVAPHPKRKIERKRGPKPKNKQNKPPGEEGKTEKKVRKQRSKKEKPDVLNETTVHQQTRVTHGIANVGDNEDATIEQPTSVRTVSADIGTAKEF